MGWNKQITILLRNWHRDIGYFVVAITLIYGISGILLTHKDAFPVISTTETSANFPLHLDIAGFSEQWNMHYSSLELTKCTKSNNAIKFFIEGGRGNYNIENGKVNFETYKKHKLNGLLVSFHSNHMKGWKHIADLYCISLIFLAISGLFIVKGKNGFKKRGLWFMLGGAALVIIFIFI